MALKKFKCRFGKIVIEDRIGIIPVRTGKRMLDLFPQEVFDLEDGFTHIVNFIDMGNDLCQRSPLPNVQRFQLAIGRFEGSVCNQEILAVLREQDLIDMSVPEEDMLWTIAHYSSPHINGDNILYNYPHLHNLFVFAGNKTSCHKILISNQPRIKDEIRWHIRRDDAYDNAYHVSDERFFFPIKKSALPSY